MEDFEFLGESEPIEFTSPTYIGHLNEVKDEFEGNGMSPDIAALAAVGASLIALSGALIEAAIEQGNEHEIVISTQMIGGLHDTVLWINDRINLSRL